MIKTVDLDKAVQFTVDNIEESIEFIRLVAALGFKKAYCFVDREIVLVMYENEYGKSFRLEDEVEDIEGTTTIIFKGTVAETAKFFALVHSQMLYDSFNRGREDWI